MDIDLVETDGIPAAASETCNACMCPYQRLKYVLCLMVSCLMVNFFCDAKSKTKSRMQHLQGTRLRSSFKSRLIVSPSWHVCRLKNGISQPSCRNACVPLGLILNLDLQSPTERRPATGMRVTTGSLPAVAKPERRPRKSDEAKMDTSLSYSVRNSTTGSVMVDGSAVEGSEEGLDTVDTVKVANTV